jgi:hypothetical protein
LRVNSILALILYQERFKVGAAAAGLTGAGNPLMMDQMASVAGALP